MEKRLDDAPDDIRFVPFRNFLFRFLYDYELRESESGTRQREKISRRCARTKDRGRRGRKEKEEGKTLPDTDEKKSSIDQTDYSDEFFFHILSVKGRRRQYPDSIEEFGPRYRKHPRDIVLFFFFLYSSQFTFFHLVPYSFLLSFYLLKRRGKEDHTRGIVSHDFEGRRDPIFRAKAIVIRFVVQANKRFDIIYIESGDRKCESLKGHGECLSSKGREEFAVGLNMQTRFFQIVVILDESARVERGYVLQLLRAESKQGAWKRINYDRVHGS
uniref:Uncharacterized protein n=1 Tax=Vespula pensylvanica TaxID=30213 RepID=A0A834N4T8_VESPE|nr:hypothetical protein H0235_016362 [Vespula pensylvanica]